MKNFRSEVVGILFLISTISLFGQTDVKYILEYPKSKDADRLPAGSVEGVNKLFGVQVDSIAPDQTGMRNLTSVELAKEMVPGWNVGNSLEAIGGETAWGNPKISQRLIDSIKAAGFRSVRIPVAWSKFTDTTFTIDTTWLNRVEEVVNYVLKDSMYAIVNEHWDNGWQQPTYAQQAYVNNRLATMWKQIAVHFRGYDDRLLFAGTNEVMVTNNYSTPIPEYYTVQNSFNQTFVTTVRSTGGRNFYRHLLVQGFNTNIDHTVNYFAAPNDVTANRLMVEVHYYDPYDFTLNENDKITQWGMYATDPAKTETWANESYADGQFQKMKTNFVDKGFGVVLGEYGATIRSALGSAQLNAQYESYRRYYMQYITRSIERHGLVPYYWDIGYYGNHGSGIFDRTTAAHVYPDILEAIIDTSKVSPVLGVRESSSSPSRFFLGQNYPNPFNPRTTISFSLPKANTVTLRVFDLLGREVVTLIESQRKAAGNYEIPFDGTKLTSGIYYYNLWTEGYRETKMMVLVK
jgi:endoglucanase